MQFEEKLYKLRKEKNLSQNELSEILDVSRQAISKWESGRTKPDTNHLILISQYFNVSLDYLIDDDTNSAEDRRTFSNDKAESIMALNNYKSKRIIFSIVYGIMLIILLILGSVFHSSAGTGIAFLMLGICFIILVVYTLIKELILNAKNKKKKEDRT